MPRSNSGVVTVPNSFTARTTIASSSVNENFADLADVIEDSLDVNGRNSMAAQLKATAGTLGTPGISFASDSDTGFALISGRVHMIKDGVSLGSFDADDFTFPLPVTFSGAVTVTGTFTAPSSIRTGTILEWGGITAPDGYLLTYGQAVSRTTYADLLSVITATATATTNGTTTLSSVSVDLTGLGLEGAVIEGSGITPGTTVVSLTSNTITISGAASGSASGVAIRILPWGAGDGSTTFNIPDKRGRVTAGRDNMGGTSANRLTDQSGGVNGDVLGDTGGSETHALTSAELAAHTHAITGATESGGEHYHGVYSGDATSGSTFGLANALNRGLGGGDNLGTGAYRYVTGGGPQAIEDAGEHTHDLDLTSGSTGSDAAHNNVQPTSIGNFIIKT